MNRPCHCIARFVCILAATATAAGLTVAATADVLVSNLSEPLRDSTPIANPEFWGGQSFVTSSSAFQISSVDIIGGNAAGTLDVVAELRKATGEYFEIDTSAGGLIGTFSASDLSGALGIRTFVPNSTMVLDPSTPYWFILGANSGTYDWSYADTGLFSGPGALGNYSDSSDAGATWTLRGNDFPYYLRVNGGSTVPEPSSALLILLGAGLGLIVLPRRRRRAATSRSVVRF